MADASSPPRIVRLPAALVNQIAAGEVVERAASVVKELCENSIDAGARRIDVELVAGGRSLIRIVDDGGGMTSQEARLALERHATSKIRCESDLWGVETFGFRGEALPSIASVSRLTLKTCPPEANEGFLLEVHAGQEVRAAAVGMAAGTQIEVRDLFFNTPARLKFQKTEATETSNVSEALLRLAVANPDVHIRLRINGRTAMDLPPHRDLAERVRAAMAKRGAGLLHEAVGDENGVCVQAFLAAPECASTTSRNTFTFVGRRFVRDRSLLQALCMGYGDSIEKGRYPLAIVFVDVPGEDVDVNVHPQKLEVRFAQPQPVYAAVRHVLSTALEQAPWGMRAGRPYSFAPATRAKAATPFPEPRAREGSVADLDRAYRMSPPAMPPQGSGEMLPQVAPAEPTPRRDRVPYGFFSHQKPLGTLGRRYILLEDPDGALLVLDAAAAEECILLRTLRMTSQAGRLQEQRLLFPIPIEIDEAVMEPFARQSDILERLGFNLGQFGPQTVLVRAVPELAGNVDPKPLVLSVLKACAACRDQAADTSLDRVFEALAQQIVAARTDLDSARVAALLSDMDSLGLGAAPLEGRSLLWRLPLDEIHRRFGRR